MHSGNIVCGRQSQNVNNTTNTMDVRALLVLVLVTSCATSDIRKYADGSSQIVPYETGGIQISFTGIEVPANALTRCLVRFFDGQDSFAVMPSIPYDRRSPICRLPPDVYSGRVQVDLEIRGASPVPEVHSGNFFINPNPSSEIKVEENWYTNEVSFTWNPEYFSQFFPPGSPIILEANVYVSEGAEPKFSSAGVVMIVGINAGNGKAIVSLPNVEKMSNFLYPYFYILRPVATQSGIFLSSRLFTPILGMHERRARDVCQSWLSNATGPPTDVTPCPPCLCKAKIDSNFIQAEYHQQILELSGGQLANHVLYYQRVPTAQGHAQTCSYNTHTDALSTSSPAQAAWVHQVSKDVSYIENYFADIWPYLVCCLQTNSAGYCEMFHEKRPIDTGHTYPGPGDPCYGTGDPHMNTFNGVYYDFMGWGEFWLIRGPPGSQFAVQGRMAPFHPDQRVSYYRALAIKDGDTSVQLQYRGSALQMLVNGIDIQLPPNGIPKLSIDTISITVTGARVSIRFRAGFTITVDSFPQGYFNVYGSGAAQNRGKGYRGIFGLLDADRENDLTNRDGYVIPPTSENIRNLSLIHNMFGLTWMITEEESIFVYDEGTSWADYNNPLYGPIFSYPNPADMPAEVRAICGNSLACYYEYVGTGDLMDAQDTVQAEKEHEELVEEIAKKIPMCDPIPSPNNGRVSAEGYLDGSIATYSCNEEYEIINEPVTRTCSASEQGASWSGAEPTCVWTCTRCAQDAEYQLSHDPSDCTKFFLCSYGFRMSLLCPAGEVFSRDSHACGNYRCMEPSC